jgi:trk system potassium uptake protein TrkH
VRLAVVLGVIGRLVRLFSAAFLPPLVLALADGQFGVALHFVVALGASVAGGTLLSWASPIAPHFHRAEAMAVVAGTWLAIAFFGAVPFLFAGFAPVDALFESMSGFTTTGATVLTDFERYGRAFFLWRAMIQWFGGLGVIALFVVVLPRLGIAGRQLFFNEASEASDSISPQIHQNAKRLWLLYTILTAIQAVLLIAFKLPVYDAIVHSLATLASGGFSSKGSSVATYGNPGAEWVFVIFMMLAGTSFPLQWKAFTGRPLAFFRDSEFIFYVFCAAAGTLAVSFLLAGGVPDAGQLRTAAFQCASLISSTGFASTDFNLWSDGARATLMAVALIGGCAGSSAGGAKAIRHFLVLKFLRREITHVLHPYSVIPLRLGHRIVPPAILRAVFTLVVLFMLGYFLVGLSLVLAGADLVTGFSAALACLGNIGPGLGAVGPMASYAELPAVSKLILIAAMWIGRLEIVTVLALLHPHVWRHLQLRGRRRPGG